MLTMANIPSSGVQNGMKTRNKTHPEVQKPPCFAPGFRNHRSPPVSNSEAENTIRDIKSCERETSVRAEVQHRTAGRRYPTQDRLFPHIINIPVTYGELSAHHRLSTINNDRMGDGHPFCATSLLHRGLWEDYPMVIQSFLFILPGERKTLRRTVLNLSHNGGFYAPQTSLSPNYSQR